MNWKIALYGLIIIMGAINIGLQVWLLLLNARGAQPLWIGLGVLFIVAGVVSIRRERQAMDSQNR